MYPGVFEMRLFHDNKIVRCLAVRYMGLIVETVMSLESTRPRC